jgi:hypothetical protein
MAHRSLDKLGPQRWARSAKSNERTSPAIGQGHCTTDAGGRHTGIGVISQEQRCPAIHPQVSHTSVVCLCWQSSLG